MIELLFSQPIVFFILFPGLLMSIAVHEFAHAWAADQLGDPTARVRGRLTLDPRVHLDPLGTLSFLFFHFGWGKPAPFDPYNLKDPIRDTALIALAGPVSNLIIALALSLMINFSLIPFPIVLVSAAYLLLINIILAIFNLIPVHPLDGSKIAMALLPKRTALEYEQIMQKYGVLILIFLIFPWSSFGSPVSRLMWPLIQLIVNLLLGSQQTLLNF